MDTAAHRTRDELADTIRGMSAADWGRLRQVAGLYARGRPIEPEDLLQEAFRRALDGGRNCPAQVDVVKFLAEAMRSIADGEQEKSNKRPTLVPIDNYGTASGVIDPPDPSPDAAQQYASDEEAAAIKRAALDLFEDDPIAQIILEGMMEQMEGEELRELTELDATAYQSKRKLIRRRIDKKFPEGWTQ